MRAPWFTGLLLCLLGAGTTAAAPHTPGANPPWQASPTLHGLDQAHTRADGTLVITGQLSGTGTLQARQVLVTGTVAPGNSPGCINFGGNVTFGTTATLQIEIGGLIPCTGYDRITVANQLTLNGPTLQLSLYNGFVPGYGDRFDILDWGSLSGTFGSIDTSAAALPVPLVWDTADLYLTGEVAVGVQHFADGDLAPWNNPDGQIDAADVLIASQLVLGTRTAGALQLAHGDMNADGTIDLADLLLIVRAVFH